MLENAIQKCFFEYAKLFSDRLKVAYDSDDSAIIVTGTPGVGKSIFLGYVWPYHLVKIKHEIVAIYGNQIIS